MKKRAVFLILFLIVFSLIVVSAIENNKISKISGEVYSKIDKMENNESIRVMIKINEQKQTGKSISLAADNIKSQLKGKIMHDFGNRISVVVTKEELANLEKNSDVYKIENERMFNVMLQDSVGIINSSITNNIKINSLNLTGKGETVCVIDTGINYSHADLGGCYGNNSASSNCKVVGGIDYCADNTNCFTSDGVPEDIHGHGTHVSGIIAANGSIKGVAPESRIVMIKACNSTGSCSESGIQAGIQWCVGNSSALNISVISMSLGGDSYADYCNLDTLAGAINAAYAKNISVVVAAGNSGSNSYISSPACVQNATPVSSTTKLDAISSFSNRNSLVKLMAPGTDITSTYPGGYLSMSGTSMATPHVAGAIAIMRQFLKIINQTKTPKQIETVLNNTGKIINDANGLNYSRINVYSAIFSLDEINVTLSAPANNLFTSSNQTFRCNTSSSLPLVNLSFYIWNSTSLINVSNIDISGLANSSNFTFNFTYEDNYKWNCLASDNLSKSIFATTNFSVIYDLTPLIINITSPINNSWYNAGIFNITLNENGSCLYSLNYGINNFTMSSVDNQNFNATNATLLQDNSYNVSFYCNDSAGNRNNSIRTFKIDLIPPNVTLTDPFPTDETSNSVSKIFYYNVSDNLNLSRCNLILNGASVAENATEITNTTNNITYTLTPAIYSWNINCTDIAGNIGNSSSRSIVITSPPVTVNNNNGGGGGGGGGSPSSGVNSILNAQQSEQGTSRELKTNDKITFEIKTPLGNEKHSLVLNNITDSRINITISSNPINLILGVGQSAKLNLTSSDYYNLFIKLEGIRENKANLTVKVINEPIKITAEENNESIQQMETPQNTKKENNVIYYVLEALIIIIIIALIRYLMKQPKRTRSRR
jgi:subtilisin family serine protease